MDKGLAFEILTLVLGFILAIIPSIDSLRDESFKDWRKNWKVILSLIGFVLLAYVTISKFRDNSKAIEGRQYFEDSVQKASTKVIQHGIDSSSNKLFADFSSALAKQGLSFDSVNLEFKKLLKDSAKTVYNIDSSPDPELLINNIKVERLITIDSAADITSISIDFYSNKAGSKIVDLKYYWISKAENGQVIVEGSKAIRSGVVIPSNMPIGQRGVPVGALRSNKIKEVFFYLTGKCTSVTGAKIIPINEWYGINLISGEFGYVSKAQLDDLMKLEPIKELLSK